MSFIIFFGVDLVVLSGSLKTRSHLSHIAEVQTHVCPYRVKRGDFDFMGTG